MTLSASSRSRPGRWLAILLLLVWPGAGALAHEFRTALLDVTREGEAQFSLRWTIPKVPGWRSVSLQASPFCTLRFQPYAERDTRGGGEGQIDCAADHPLQSLTVTGLGQASFDVIARLNGVGDEPRITVVNAYNDDIDLKPSQAQAGGPTLLMEGVRHVLGGPDHLVYVLLLFLYLRRSWRAMIVGVTIFTVAHSLTLAAAALEVIQVPARPVEAVIGLTIAWFAIAILRGRPFEGPKGGLWKLAVLLCGLIHGLGYANSLAVLGLPPGRMLWGLATFNLGIEVGQVLLLAGFALTQGLYTMALGEQSAARLKRGAAGLSGVIGAYWYFSRLI